MVKEITDKVGVSTANPILRHPGGIRMKKIDEYHFKKLVKVMMESAECLDLIKICQQFSAVIDCTFD